MTLTNGSRTCSQYKVLDTFSNYPSFKQFRKTYILYVRFLLNVVDPHFQDELMFLREKWQTMEEYQKAIAWEQRSKSFLSIAPRDKAFLVHVLHNTILFLQYSHSHQ